MSTLDTAAFRDAWKTRIQRDLCSFGDPGCLVTMNEIGQDLHASWTVRGEQREAYFSISTHRGVRVKRNGRRVPYNVFLAGPECAHLEDVAKMIRQSSRSTYFVPTKAECEDGETPAPAPAPAVELLTRLLEDSSDTTTSVVMITGDPGSGKTSVLRHLVESQASRYLRGQTTKLLLYVNAQGRALARLNEALATELQDLKVSLTYHSVTTLARQGILVPVIDGFDELLGLSGYDDAFSSLSAFLDEMGGEGCVFASSRSTYYEEEFVARASNASGPDTARWTQIPVRVRGWSTENQADFIQRWGDGKGLSVQEQNEIKNQAVKVFSGQKAEFGQKPLFFTKTVELLQHRPEFGQSDDLLDELVNEYLDRELNEKLLDRHSAPLLTKSQFDAMMCEVAQEMWNQETRELDVNSIREVAEYVTEIEGISEANRRILIERMPTLAFLGRGDGNGGRGRIAFEHELFFFYFLARSIAAQFKSGQADLRTVLSRSAMPEQVANRIAIDLVGAKVTDSDRDLQKLLVMLHRAGTTEWRRSEQVRENAGLLVMALFQALSVPDADGSKAATVRNRTVQGLVFPGENLNGITFRHCRFKEVTVKRTDLMRTQFLECEAQNLLLLEPRVNPEYTRLDIDGLNTSQIVGLSLPSGERIYDPAKVNATLAKCGVDVPTKAGKEEPTVDVAIVGLVESLMRAYRRKNPICLQDDTLASLFSNPKWEGVKKQLLQKEIVAKERRPTGGKNKEFLRRRFRPDQIMAGLSSGADIHPNIRAFWKSFRTSK